MISELERFLGGIFSVGGKGADFFTEMILFVTTAVAGNQQSYRVPREGYIVGFHASASSGFDITVNVDGSSATISAAGVYSGYVWPSAGAPNAAYPFHGCRQHVNENDLVNVRTTQAQAISVYVLFAYALPSPN